MRNSGETAVERNPSREVGQPIRPRPLGGSAAFTLLEVTVTLAVVSVLVAVAMPTTVNTLRNLRLNAAVAAASGAISATRYQAIMHAYSYTITFNSVNATYQVASEPPGTASFTNVGSAIPLSEVGDVTLNPTTTFQLNANGTVSATTGTLSFVISNSLTSHTITVSGVGDVSSN
jgi:prepilin-type N-terminal cleavage/methylation domain-containing protein